MSQENEYDEDSPGLLGTLLPYLIGTCLFTIAVMVSILRFVPSNVLTPVYTEAPAIVTFDVVKYMNAQRAVASAFLKPDHDKQAINELLVGLSDRARDAILSQAGPGTIVLLKQTVVQGQFKDITDDVLRELRLPVKEVPTSDGVDYVLDHAPTMMLSVPTMQKFIQHKSADVSPSEDILP